MNAITAPETTLSYIEPHEEAEAQALIDKQFTDLCGKPFRDRPCGYMCVIKIYVRPNEVKVIKDAEGNDHTLYLPDLAVAEDRFQSCTGLVISIGPGAFMNPDGTPRYHGPRPFKKGDFVIFPRADIIRVDFRGVALGLLKDDRGLVVIEDPADYTPGHLGTRL